MGFLISGDDTLRTLALRWTHVVRKIYFGGSNFLKVNNLGPVAGFFQSSALPTELLGRIVTGRERGQGNKRAPLKRECRITSRIAPRVVYIIRKACAPDLPSPVAPHSGRTAHKSRGAIRKPSYLLRPRGAALAG